jgi:dGTPase
MSSRDPNFAVDFETCVSAACLAHDVGNPPFGHSGESAIAQWFNDNPSKWHRNTLTTREALDFVGFDGNAQGFRILTRLGRSTRAFGLQLTVATLGAFCKYPRESGEYDVYDVSSRKPGFFQDDKHAFEEVAARAGLARRSGHSSAWARHPLAFLTEAADNISYLLMDLEDGYRIGDVSHEDYRRVLEPLLEMSRDELRTFDKPPGSYEEQKERAAGLRARAAGTLIDSVAAAFVTEHENILAGTFANELTQLPSVAGRLDDIRQVLSRDCYRARDVLTVELAGFAVIASHLEMLVAAIDSPKAKRSEKLIALIPRFRETGRSWYQRLLDVTDYVAGMTDSYAVTLYRYLNGVALPGGRW